MTAGTLRIGTSWKICIRAATRAGRRSQPRTDRSCGRTSYSRGSSSSRLSLGRGGHPLGTTPFPRTLPTSLASERRASSLSCATSLERRGREARSLPKRQNFSPRVCRRACRLRPKGDLVNGAQQHSWQLRQGSGLDKRRYCVCMSQSLPVSRSTLDMCSAYTVAALGSSCLVAARLDSMLTVSIARPAWEGQSRLAKAILECVILAVSAPCLTQASRPPPSPPRSGCPLPARLTSPPLARTAGTGPACTAQGWSANGNIIREDRR